MSTYTISCGLHHAHNADCYQPTKRTHGPCTCAFAAVYAIAPGAAMTGMEHAPDCHSLYPAQQEPDALTRLTRFLRSRVGHVLRDDETEEALSLLSEAREERSRIRNAVLTHAADLAKSIADNARGYPERQKAALDVAAILSESKDSEP